MSVLSFFSTSDGQRIAYRYDGQPGKPVLVLSNSIATTLHMWDGQVQALARHFHVLRYDARGHGASDAPAGPYDLERLGRDVLELLDTLGVGRAHFLGLSLGGIVGQWLGVHAPDRIDRLVLSNTSPYLGPADQWGALIDSVLRAPDLSQAAEMFMGNWFPPQLRRDTPELVERFRAMVMHTPAQGLAGNFGAVRDTDLRAVLGRISRPTLVIAGRDDTVTLASHGEQIAAAVPGAGLVMLQAVHMPNVEVAEEFLQAVLAFLAESPNGG
ncbi:3-oxoadipate enol-lactonase [Bordetella sp. BOR01]|uniref:3-oxoadipate enol-lactonase n=1 Tax=Bordetella sp. BOR01 TaxID=2854779 RepID=UPI001C452597|nr:3-oxoadipate enol-lactonase [Bordetella sp. BOR01]MBV7482293.1 3-oxoadipate enol-lactonase [Bordetella sp. BOR01]